MPSARKSLSSRARTLRFPVALTLAIAAVSQPAALGAQTSLAPSIQQLSSSDREVSAFYAARQYRPLWIRGGALAPEADILLGLLRTSDADGRDPNRFLRLGVGEAMDAARRGSPQALGLAEVVLSKAFAAYVRDVRRPAEIGVIYGEPSLASRIPSTLTVLHHAAAAPSLKRYLETMGWMHPIYADLRRALASSSFDSGVMFEKEERVVRLNLERARILPANESRYIMVDAAAARLFYYENGEVRDSMRVVVGTPDQKTPMMVGLLRYATLNPYWHVPPDLTRARIAPRVLSEGLSYFNGRGYEIVTEWSKSARIIDPKTVDWKAVADGTTEILVRQKPGPRNGMGKVKFQFPNELGIYLHDTPAKQLFNEDQRGFSAGCVRLEDADRLGRILAGRELRHSSGEPEQTVILEKPVPIYITYLTAVAENGRIVERRDIYGRDANRSASAARSSPPAGLQ